MLYKVSHSIKYGKISGVHVIELNKFTYCYNAPVLSKRTSATFEHYKICICTPKSKKESYKGKYAVVY